jgi:phage tail sheath protein FI
MPEYLSPGVYIEEFEIGARPIEGVSTSTAGFLGETERGPEKPRFVSGFEQFKRIYGGHLGKDRFLAYAVDGFFNNGGQRCFVGRIVHRDKADPANDAVSASAIYDTVSIEAVGPGEWGNRIAVKIGPGSLDQTTAPPRNCFKLTVMYWGVAPPTVPPVDPTDPQKITDKNRRDPDLIEVYDNLNADQASMEYYVKMVNSQSNLIRLTRQADNNPTDMDLTLLPNIAGAIQGSNGTGSVNRTDYQGSQRIQDGTTLRTGFEGFKEIDEISIVCVPDHHRIEQLTTDVILHCTQMKDRFAVLHSNPSTHTLASISEIWPPQDTTFAAFYFPWIKVYDPLTRRDLLTPPSGHVAGIYAKTDVERGVHKAPANEVVVGATALQFQITKAEQDMLNPRGVNCLRVFPGRGLRVWGARTCSNNTLWKYINVRRLFLYVEESIEEATQWVVFEPNNEKLWARVRATITEFLTRVWRDGALMGLKPQEAFFVKCDRTTMTQSDIDNGRLICIIGIAPVKPAEFVIFRITQWQGGSAATE